jgi:hypothetical protein
MNDGPPQPPLAPRPPAAGSAYSFAVALAPDGKRAVVITEIRQVGDRCERHRVIVAEPELAGFLGGLQAVVATLAPAGPGRAYSVAEARSRHPKAYAPWSPAEDQRLLARHRQGAEVRELAREFGRKGSAIRSRLVRLGVGLLPSAAPAEPVASAGKQAEPSAAADPAPLRQGPQREPGS